MIFHGVWHMVYDDFVLYDVWYIIVYGMVYDGMVFVMMFGKVYGNRFRDRLRLLGASNVEEGGNIYFGIWGPWL